MVILALMVVRFILHVFASHFYLALLPAGPIALHGLAALYHQFARRDGLLQRMWFCRRPALPVAK